MIKHLKISGNSTISWKDAITKTIEEVSRTIDNLNCVTILEQTAKIENNIISEYNVVLDICFVVDNNRRKSKEEGEEK